MRSVIRLLLVLLVLVVLATADLGAQQPPDPFKVMITEVSWDEPDGLEITNFGPTPADLSSFRVEWVDASGRSTSALLGTVLAPGASMVVLEQNPVPAPEIPPGVPVVPALPVLNTTTEGIIVALVDAGGAVTDAVVITATSGVPPPGTVSGFRGHARRGQLFMSKSVERIQGLDSDGGTDWTEEVHRGFGLESRSAGARSGIDTVQLQPVWINEVSTSPVCVELVNRSPLTLDLVGWYLLVSEAQGAPLRRVDPWPAAFALPPGNMVVIGDAPSPPPELPAGGRYVPLPSGTPLALGPAELSLGLYDRLGRLVDLVRATGEATTVVHNHPRVPSWPADFFGAAPRLLAGDRAFGRAAQTPPIDTNTGSDWTALATRTMGSANTGFVGAPGHGDAYDVRVNEGPGDGLTVILNAGVASAVHRYGFFLSQDHLDGTGPFFGLGPDALFNWIALSALPPFSGILDDRGSARFDFPAGTLAPGLRFDCIFIVQLPNGILTKRTLIVEYDT